MAALPVVSGEQACRALARAGFSRKSQRGSHVKMRHPDGRNTVVPMHKELAFRTPLRPQAGGAHRRGVPAAAVLEWAVLPAQSEGAPPYREPLFSLRRPSRSPLARFLAHLLIRLLIVTALPAHLQVAAALFPVSILWPLVEEASSSRRVAEGAFAPSSVAKDRNGNRLSQRETNGGTTETTTYTYDALNRLKTVTYPADAGFPSGRKVEYGYDNVGDRTSELTTDPTSGAVLASKTGAFDNVNRLTLLTDNLDPTQTTSFTWDANGNQTSKTTAGLTTEYRYDTRNQMVETAEGASVLGRFQYDFEGRRTKKIGEEGTRQYVYDDTSTLLEYDGSGGQVAKYDWGSDRLISLFRRDEPRRFYSFDALGSVTNLTDDSGSAVASYHLDAWGNFRFSSELDASRNRFAFTGYLFDPETDLYYAKARFYDPETGRFTTQDSVLGEINDPPSLHRYFYGNANPLRYVDPTGHQAEIEHSLTFGDACSKNPAACQAQGPTPDISDVAAGTLGVMWGGVKLARNIVTGTAQFAHDVAIGTLFLDEQAARRALDTLVNVPVGLLNIGTGKTERAAREKAYQRIAEGDYFGGLSVYTEEGLGPTAAVAIPAGRLLAKTRLPAGVRPKVGAVSEGTARAEVAVEGRAVAGVEAAESGAVVPKQPLPPPVQRVAGASPGAEGAAATATRTTEAVESAAPNRGMPGVVVRDTAHMSAEARAFQRIETAIEVPWKTKPSPRMRDVVSFDDWDAATNQLIDRKTNVTRYPKSVDQAARQAEVARQHGVGVRWEVPANKVNAAKDLVKRAKAEGVIAVVEGR